MTSPRKTPTFDPIYIHGPVGPLECLRLEASSAPATGIALVAHPNPLEGGTFTNKIVHTLAKVLARRGYTVYCPNLRGVGQSAGSHDRGRGEVDDMAAVLNHALHEQPQANQLVLAGFSFGTYVQAQLRQRLEHTNLELQLQPMILVGAAISRYDFPTVPANTLMIHGEHDEVIALADVMHWARPQKLPILVVPDAGHFFHGRLTDLTQIVEQRWRG